LQAAICIVFLQRSLGEHGVFKSSPNVTESRVFKRDRATGAVFEAVLLKIDDAKVVQADFGMGSTSGMMILADIWP